MKKLGKILFIIIVIFLGAIILYGETQYAIFEQYIFERPRSGQMNISNSDIKKTMVINDRSIILDGVYTEYEMVEKEWRTYEIALKNENGVNFYNASNFGTSLLTFHSRTNHIGVGGGSGVHINADGESENLTYEELNPQKELLVYSVLVHARYQVLNQDFKALLFVLIPLACIGYLMCFESEDIVRFLDEKSSSSNQLYESHIKCFGAVIFLIGLLLALGVVYI